MLKPYVYENDEAIKAGDDEVEELAWENWSQLITEWTKAGNRYVIFKEDIILLTIKLSFVTCTQN